MSFGAISPEVTSRVPKTLPTCSALPSTPPPPKRHSPPPSPLGPEPFLGPLQCVSFAWKNGLGVDASLLLGALAAWSLLCSRRACTAVMQHLRQDRTAPSISLQAWHLSAPVAQVKEGRGGVSSSVLSPLSSLWGLRSLASAEVLPPENWTLGPSVSLACPPRRGQTAASTALPRCPGTFRKGGGCGHLGCRRPAGHGLVPGQSRAGVLRRGPRGNRLG